MKNIEDLNIGRIYNEETINKIISKNKMYKVIYTKEIESFKWGKEKAKLLEIIDGYESNGTEFNNIKIKYLILEPQSEE